MDLTGHLRHLVRVARAVSEHPNLDSAPTGPQTHYQRAAAIADTLEYLNVSAPVILGKNEATDDLLRLIEDATSAAYAYADNVNPDPGRYCADAEDFDYPH
ncbi:hypothetical protein [Glycomyces sp. NPDC048151]|uniref:hypothetical protein n=1 Tax=Glycomyces sp. NPDC048151 TaxID=3364002 RepID=UPI003722F027